MRRAGKESQVEKALYKRLTFLAKYSSRRRKNRNAPIDRTTPPLSPGNMRGRTISTVVDQPAFKTTDKTNSG